MVFSGTGDKVTIRRQQDVIRRVIDVTVVQGVAQKADGYVESKDGNSLVVLVPERNGITHHRYLEDFVDIGICPKRTVRRNAFFIESRLSVVVFFTSSLHRLNLIVLTIGIRLKQASFFRIIIGDKGDTTTHHIRMCTEHPLCRLKHRVGTGQVTFYVPDVSAQGYL